jgi:hypothetical protein
MVERTSGIKTTATDMKEEKNQLQQEAMSMEQWWSHPRWKYTKRNYTGT